MRFLLDTNVLLWFLVNHTRLTSNNSFRVLEIRMEHLRRVAALPLIHRDPFDRLLIAQSNAENLPIITSDAAFDHYAIQRIW